MDANKANELSSLRQAADLAFEDVDAMRKAVDAYFAKEGAGICPLLGRAMRAGVRSWADAADRVHDRWAKAHKAAHKV